MAKLRSFGAALALAAGLAGPALAEGETAATVVATVNGKEITLGHMIALRESLPAQYQSLPDDALFSGILNQLIQQEALAQTAGDLPPRAALTLDNENRGFLSGQALRGVIEGAVTDAALQAAYDAKYGNVPPAKEYNAAHILVAAEDKARELKAALDAGADFAQLAKEHSTDTGSGSNGGDLGWFGLGMMVKPFEDAVVAAEAGKVTDPVQSQFGWHLILVKEVRDAAKPTLDDVREELAAELESKAIEAHVADVTAKATVTRPGEGIDPARLRDLTLIGE
jgi:peptidyl-prolyl cis-trans isomerase C